MLTVYLPQKCPHSSMLSMDATITQLPLCVILNMLWLYPLIESPTLDILRLTVPACVAPLQLSSVAARWMSRGRWPGPAAPSRAPVPPPARSAPSGGAEAGAEAEVAAVVWQACGFPSWASDSPWSLLYRGCWTLEGKEEQKSQVSWLCDFQLIQGWRILKTKGWGWKDLKLTEMTLSKNSRRRKLLWKF